MATDKRKKPHSKAGQATEPADHRLAFVTAARNGGFVEPSEPSTIAAVPTDQIDLRNELEYFDPERWDGMA